ncbi:MAG: hypothetical protein ACKVW3_09545 [Phycisphaerales bacterium]
MARTVKDIDGEVSGLASDLGKLVASASKYDGSLSKMEQTAKGLETDYDSALKEIRAKCQKEEAEAKKSYQIKLRSLATSTQKEMIQIQADAKVCRMAAEGLGQLINELRGAKGDDKDKKSVEARATQTRRGYAKLSAEISGLEAMVRKVESACRA